MQTALPSFYIAPLHDRFAVIKLCRLNHSMAIDPTGIKGKVACEQLVTSMISTLQPATLLTEETQKGIISDIDGYFAE